MAAAAFSFSHIGDGKWLRMVIPPEKQDWAARTGSLDERRGHIIMITTFARMIQPDPIWILPVHDHLESPPTPLSFQDIQDDKRTTMRTLLGETLKPAFSAQGSDKSMFAVMHWPIDPVDTYGFHYKVNDDEILWANIGVDFLVLFKPTGPPVHLQPKTICEYARSVAAKLLRFRGSMKDAQLTAQRFGTNLFLGSIVFPKKSKDIHWDDQFLFCTDGANIFFAFGKDRELSLPQTDN